MFNFHALSERIARKLLTDNPALPVRMANLIGHDLARGVYRSIYHTPEVADVSLGTGPATEGNGLAYLGRLLISFAEENGDHAKAG